MSAAPTRSNLHALRRRLERVGRGAALLRRKREALVAELFRIARPALEEREALVEEAEAAWDRLHVALAVDGSVGLQPLGLPSRQVLLEIDTRQSWGVEVPSFGPLPPVARSLGVRELAPGTADPAAEEATAAFEALVQHLVEAAPREALLERLGDQVARTTQQVKVLEQRLDPRLRAECAAMRRVLEEREREEHVRMRHLLRRRTR